MPQSTYGLLSELILTAYYKTERSDNANYTLRQIANYIAQEVAMQAVASARDEDHMGEATYANDQFIVPYNGLLIQTETATNRRYISMPNIPAGLPAQRELAYIAFTGNSTLQVFPMRNKDVFMQQLTDTPKFMILAYIEGGNIYFYNLSAIVTGTVDLKLVGSVPVGSELVNLPLNLPKNIESVIIDKILARLNAVRGIMPDTVNDNISK